MENFDIYRDIAERSGGDIYLGVVGPVRTGKSTFIRKFMDTLVLPNITDKNKLLRATDELPQPADGRTIMTTEPKFVPAEAVTLEISEGARAKVRLIDCVGFPVEGALGGEEDGKPRMVKTPWKDEEISFLEAAELGTEKVIGEHSTVAVIITTDGSITDIERAKYVDAEEKVISRLNQAGKPFIVVLNTKTPDSVDTLKLTGALSERYGCRVTAVDVDKMGEKETADILSQILLEFPVTTVAIDMPKWMQVLPVHDELISELIEGIKRIGEKVARIGDFKLFEGLCKDSERFDPVTVSAELGTGRVVIRVKPKEGEFYKTLSSECGVALEDDYKLLSYVRKMRIAGDEYAKLKEALDDVKEYGYGIVSPSGDEMVLEEPQIVKQGGRYGVKLKASAPSLHIMRVDVETEVSPVLSAEQQGEEMVNYLMSEFEVNPANIWQTDMFGKSLSMVVKESLNKKLHAVPDDVRGKLRKTLKKIVNEGKGGVICILL